MATTSKATADRQSATAGIFPTNPTEFMSKVTTLSPKAYANWWQMYVAGATEMNREFMKFVATRLQHDADLGRSLSQCKDWTEATRVHEDWVREMSEEYAEESEKLMAIVSSSAQASWNLAIGENADVKEEKAKQNN